MEDKTTHLYAPVNDVLKRGTLPTGERGELYMRRQDGKGCNESVESLAHKGSNSHPWKWEGRQWMYTSSHPGRLVDTEMGACGKPLLMALLF